MNEGFIGFGYFMTNLDLAEMTDKFGVIYYNTFINEYVINLCNSVGYFALSGIKPIIQINPEEISGLLTGKPHKVFTKDWPVELFPRDGIWPFGSKRKYRVPIYFFKDTCLFNGKLVKSLKKENLDNYKIK